MDNNILITNRYKNKIICLNLFLISVVAVLFLIISNSYYDYEKHLYLYSVVGIFAASISLYLYYLLARKWTNPYIMFYLSFIVFHFGQNILLALSIENFNYIFVKGFTTQDINLKGTIFTVWSILFFNLGALLSVQTGKNKGHRENGNVKISKIVTGIRSSAALKTFGSIVFIVTVIPAFYVVIRSAIISINYGYTGLYLLPRPMFIISFLDYLFIPGTIMLLASHKNKGLTVKSLKLIILVYATMSLIGGGRGQGLAIFVVLIIYNYIQNNRLNIGSKIKVGVLILLIIVLIPILANFRGIEDKSLANFVNTVIYTTESNVLIDTVGEMGHSMAPLLMTMKVIPSNVGFKYGESYFAAIMSAMPANFDPSGLIAYFNSKATLDNWLENYYNMSYGPGFSMIAEAYYNFGYFGLIIMVLWGVIISKLLTIKDYESIKYNSFNLYSKLVLLYSLFTFPRRPTIYFVNQIVYLIVVVFLAIKLLEGINKNSNIKTNRYRMK
jgi:oligosaccharide repeat unit polymerase